MNLLWTWLIGAAVVVLLCLWLSGWADRRWSAEAAQELRMFVGLGFAWPLVALGALVEFAGFLLAAARKPR